MNNWKVVVLIFYDHDGKILLNNRGGKKSHHECVWEFLGGSIEDDENPLDAIKREIREELNYEVDEEKDELNFVNKFKLSDNDRVYNVYYFKAKFPGFKKFSNSKEVKVTNLKLFSIDEALSLSLLPISRKLISYLPQTIVLINHF